MIWFEDVKSVIEHMLESYNYLYTYKSDIKYLLYQIFNSDAIDAILALKKTEKTKKQALFKLKISFVSTYKKEWNMDLI